MTLSKFLAVNSWTAGPAGLVYLGAGRGAGIGASLLALFPNPIVSIDFVAAGGGNLLGGCVGGTSSSVTSFVLTDLSGILGGPLGLGGILGGRSRSTTGGSRRGTVGADFTVTRGIFVAFALSSNSRLVGGRGGSFASPRAGGSFLCDSTDEALVTEEPV